ncbi:hypothetical protein [Clostridium chrysemydis]|nr:hypothetical protein [Clostridium chrysemydis]
MDIKKCLYSGDFGKIPTKKQNNVVEEVNITIEQGGKLKKYK